MRRAFSGMPLRRAAGALLCALAAACGGDGPSGTPVAESVAVTPDSATLAVGDTRQFSGSVLDGSGRPMPGRRVVWSSSSGVVATVDSTGLVSARSPGVATITATSDGLSRGVTVRVAPRPNGYDAGEIAYFTEIALGFEFGNASRTVRKWRKDLLIDVRGTPTAEDRATLSTVMRELNALIGGSVRLVEAGSAPANVEIHFVPRSLFPVVLPGATPGNDGLFYVSWDGTQHFVRATVLIATNISSPFRQHLIREELTQSLGLGQDSPTFPNSIFYSGYSETHQFSKLDEAVIEMLYRDEIRAGMAESEVRAVLSNLQRRPRPAAAAERRPSTAPQPAPGPIVGTAGGGHGAGRR